MEPPTPTERLQQHFYLHSLPARQFISRSSLHLRWVAVCVIASVRQDWAILCVLGSTGRGHPLRISIIIFRNNKQEKKSGPCDSRKDVAQKRINPFDNFVGLMIAWRDNSLRIGTYVPHTHSAYAWQFRDYEIWHSKNVGKSQSNADPSPPMDGNYHFHRPNTKQVEGYPPHSFFFFFFFFKVCLTMYGHQRTDRQPPCPPATNQHHRITNNPLRLKMTWTNFDSYHFASFFVGWRKKGKTNFGPDGRKLRTRKPVASPLLNESRKSSFEIGF